MTSLRPFAALAVLACASASAAPAQPEFQHFDGAKASSTKSAVVAPGAVVPAPHKHVLQAVTLPDGSTAMTCITEANPKFVAFQRERENTTTQEK